MKVLLVNKFNYLQGGADKYFLELADLLRSNGIEVAKFCMDHPKNLPDENSDFFVSYVDIKQKGLVNKFRYAARFFYSFEAKRKFEKLILKIKPDIIHIHNIYHQISPSILTVAKKYKIPVVMHLHDYKLISPDYTMFNRHGIDERSLGGHYYRTFFRRSFKDSYWLSLIVTLEMYFHHKILRTYEKNIDYYIAPSIFMRNKVIEAGFPPERVIHQPYFVKGIEDEIPNYAAGDYFLFFGRLSREKGIDMLLKALAKVEGARLKIVGGGNEKTKLENLAKDLGITNRVTFVGPLYGNDLKKTILESLAVVVPSTWYEVFGIVNVEAAAMGKLVIAADIAGIPETMIPGTTALVYRFDSIDALAEKLRLVALDPKMVEDFGKAARPFVISKFTAAGHLPRILAIYEKALAR